jgi:hypothetical protein
MALQRLQKINWTQIDTENPPSGVPITLGSVNNQLESVHAKNLYFVFDEPIGSSVWVIEHRMEKHPSVRIVDTSGNEWEGEVHYDSDIQLTITFRSNGELFNLTGKAYLS